MQKENSSNVFTSYEEKTGIYPIVQGKKTQADYIITNNKKNQSQYSQSALKVQNLNLLLRETFTQAVEQLYKFDESTCL